MKHLIYVTIAIGFLSLAKLSAQANLNDPTVSKLNVQFRSLPLHTLRFLLTIIVVSPLKVNTFSVNTY